MARILLGEPDLPLTTLVALSRPKNRVALSERSKKAIDACRAIVDRAVRKGATMYGINTGFGKLAGVRIVDAQLGQLQKNLLLSHATGVGEPLTVPQSRLAFALRIHNLALGSSGVRRELVDQAIALWNADMIPVIPSQGSVGASGDLAPLSHMALPLIGYGEVRHNGRVISGATALRRLERRPLQLAEKEGLAELKGASREAAAKRHRDRARERGVPQRPSDAHVAA